MSHNTMQIDIIQQLQYHYILNAHLMKKDYLSLNQMI